MKKLFTLILTITVFGQFAWAQIESSINGKWTNEDQTQIVEVSKVNDYYVGTLIFIDAENAKLMLDTENDDESKRNRRILGSNVWTKFEFQEDKGFWKYGEIYDYKSGNTYNGKIQVEGDELKLTGHYGFFFFLAKTQKWSRVTK